MTENDEFLIYYHCIKNYFILCTIIDLFFFFKHFLSNVKLKVTEGKKEDLNPFK